MATFVDPSAATNGDGTLATPYNTWTGRSFPADGRLLQKWGTTTTTPIAPTGNGTAAQRAVVGVYHPDTGAWMEDVVGGAFVDATGTSYGIGLGEARTYVTVSGFEVYGGDDYGILKLSTASSSTEAQHNWLVNCILRDSLGVGADLRGLGNKVINCQIYGNASDGLFIVGDNFELDETSLWRNGLTNSDGDCVQLRDSSNFYIHDSDLDHSASLFKQALICTLQDVAGTTGGLVLNTRIACAQYVSGVTAADQKTLQILTPGVKVRRCTIEGGQFGAYMQGVGGTLEDSLLIVTGSGAVVGVAIREDGVSVRRNTVIGGGGAYGIDHSATDFTGVTINDNGVKNWAAGIRTHTGATYLHNGFEDCLIRNATSLGEEGTAGTGDVESLGLSAGYEPIDGSALLNAGVHLGYSTDRNGRARHNPPTIGAYEGPVTRDER